MNRMSLAGRIGDLKKGMAVQLSADTLQIMQQATAAPEEAGIAQQSLKTGDAAPDFALPDIHGTVVKLADLLAKGPVVLSFYRGGWCPFCNLELRALQKALPEINTPGASLLAISPELPEKGAATQASDGLSFPVLSDRGNEVARAYGLVFTLPEELRPIYESFDIDLPAYNGDESFELPMPATYIVRPDGTVAHAFVDADYTQRMEPAEIVEILKTL
ncbi:MAG: peroxiredoxin-like family protein [Mariprofundaceae bacterium]|nr:peroxiredoxin-like family protein [Mariprofundaceae bacterium]